MRTTCAKVFIVLFLGPGRGRFLARGASAEFPGVCAWMVPATGLPMPLFSYGGSSTLVALLSLALVLNVAARRVPVLAADGYL